MAFVGNGDFYEDEDAQHQHGESMFDTTNTVPTENTIFSIFQYIAQGDYQETVLKALTLVQLLWPYVLSGFLILYISVWWIQTRRSIQESYRQKQASLERHHFSSN